MLGRLGLLLIAFALSGCAGKVALFKDPLADPRSTADATAGSSSSASTSAARAIETLERAGAYPLTLYVYIAPGERAPAGVDVMAIDPLLAERTTTTTADGIAPLSVRTIALPIWRARFPGGPWVNVPAPQVVPGPDG